VIAQIEAYGAFCAELGRSRPCSRWLAVTNRQVSRVGFEGLLGLEGCAGAGGIIGQRGWGS
jgi:hypothetical protein